MDEERLCEIEKAIGEYVKVKELAEEIRRCWRIIAWLREITREVELACNR